MLKRRATSKRQEILNRTICVDSVIFSVFRRAEKPRGTAAYLESRSWLELRGQATEPLGEVHCFVVSLHLDDREEPGSALPPSVGAILSVKPEVHAVIGIERESFDRIWALATSKELRYCWLAFTRPVRRSALIVSASFSNQVEE
jgi:hypothetical protein